MEHTCVSSGMHILIFFQNFIYVLALLWNTTNIWGVWFVGVDLKSEMGLKYKQDWNPMGRGSLPLDHVKASGYSVVTPFYSFLLLIFSSFLFLLSIIGSRAWSSTSIS